MKSTKLPYTQVAVFDIETTLDHQHIHMGAWQYLKRDSNGIWVVDGEVVACEGYAGMAEFMGKVPVCGHNIIGFDLPVMLHVAGMRHPEELVVDTLLLAQMLYPDNPGGHSLAKLAHLVGEQKMTSPDFETYTEEMLKYGIHDVCVTAKLAALLMNQWEAGGYSMQALALENKVKAIVKQVELDGFKLDTTKALAFKERVESEIEAINNQLISSLYPNVAAVQGRTTRAPEELCGLAEVEEIYRRFAISEAIPESKVGQWRVTPVNLNSRTQLIQRLLHAGWEPKKYTLLSQEKAKLSGATADLTPILDEAALEKSPIEGAKKLGERFRLVKTLGFISKWLELQHSDGRVYGRIMSIGAPTARMSHFNPNVAQTPKVGNPNGKECRECWTVEEGNVLVGTDASGLELRCLAHYCNDPVMSAEILEGDIHTANMQAIGLTSRDAAKTFIYAWLYGSGGAALALQAGMPEAWGNKAKAKLLKRWKPIEVLLLKLEKYAKLGYVPGLDGRRVHVRKAFAVLNTLLQSAGAIIMKQALVNVVQWMQEASIKYKIVAIVHDEFQIEVAASDATVVQELSVRAIVEAGVQLGMRVPLSGESKIGSNWAETH